MGMGMGTWEQSSGPEGRTIRQQLSIACPGGPDMGHEGRGRACGGGVAQAADSQ